MEQDPETARLRLRVRQLRELFETAGEFSSALDEESLLHVVIRKARQLIGTDLAYLMVLDHERGDTYMRASDGAIGPEFDNIRLGFGLGLGGQVAQTMSPRWTRNYLEDEQYTHVIDPIIIDEGLKAILGVPVKKHGRLTGVLFTSDRSEREFSENQITMLSLLAEHASIAISNAEDRSDLETRLAKARTLITELEASDLRQGRELRGHDSLTDLVFAGASVGALVDALTGLTGGSVLVLDENLRETEASTAQRALPGLELIRSRVESQPPTESLSPIRVESEIGGPAVLFVPVASGEDHLGFLACTEVDESGYSAGLLRRAAGLIALVLLGRRARDEADNRLRGEILAEILTGTPGEPEAVVRRARLLDVDLTSGMIAAVVMPVETPVARIHRSETSTYARQSGGLATSYGDRLVLLLPGSDPDRTAAEIASVIGHLGVVVGTSGLVGDPGQVRDHVERARRAARLLVTLGRSGTGASTEELGLYGLLFSEVDREFIQTFVDQSIGAVRDYDRSRDTALQRTLRAYFDAEGNVARTADMLFVHVNTVYQRMERLDKVLGVGWRSGDRALEIRLALRLYELMVG